MINMMKNFSREQKFILKIAKYLELKNTVTESRTE